MNKSKPEQISTCPILSYNDCLEVFSTLSSEIVHKQTAMVPKNRRQVVSLDRAKNVMCDLVQSNLEGVQFHFNNYEGFLIILSEVNAKIMFVSENCEKFTPWKQSQLIGRSLADIVDEQDEQKIRHHLSRKKSNLPPKYCKNVDYPKLGDKLFFHLRMKTQGDFNHFNFMGNYRRFDPINGDESLGEYFFLGFIRPVKDRLVTEFSMLESLQDQYITRHTPTGKIVYVDHRVSAACGYLPSDITGRSGFDFIKIDDLPWSIMANRQMFANSSREGSSIYRLRCKDGKFITLQSKGYVEFNEHTQKIDSFMCINTVIRDEDGAKYLEQQKRKFTPFIEKHKKIIKIIKDIDNKNGGKKRKLESSPEIENSENHQKRHCQNGVGQEEVTATDVQPSQEESKETVNPETECSILTPTGRMNVLLNLINNPKEISPSPQPQPSLSKLRSPSKL